MVISFFLILSFTTCIKSDDHFSHELNISLKNLEGIGPDDDIFQVQYYPNPFEDHLNVAFASTSQIHLFIADGEGGWKKFSFDGSSSAQLDFSQEKSGTYYMEVESGDHVYRTYVIKK